MDVVSFPAGCRHQPIDLGPVTLNLCETDPSGDWERGGEVEDPDRAMAAAFGDFDLAGTLNTVSAPVSTTLVYTPAGADGRRRLRRLPAGRWIRATADLWMSTDHQVLLLAPVDPTTVRRLTR